MITYNDRGNYGDDPGKENWEECELGKILIPLKTYFLMPILFSKILKTIFFDALLYIFGFPTIMYWCRCVGAMSSKLTFTYCSGYGQSMTGGTKIFDIYAR